MNKLFPIVLVLVLFLISCGLLSSICTKGDCQNGYGTKIYINGSEYVGEFKDGRKHGQGTYTWPNGKKKINVYRKVEEKYVGGFKDGQYHGYGTYTWPNKEKYVGEFKDGQYHGYGTYTWASYYEYWDEDGYHSHGRMYKGEWKDGRKHGQGTLTWHGHKYVGEFKDGYHNGQGTQYLPNGEELNGPWIGATLNPFYPSSKTNDIWRTKNPYRK